MTQASMHNKLSAQIRDHVYETTFSYWLTLTNLKINKSKSKPPWLYLVFTYELYKSATNSYALIQNIFWSESWRLTHN